MRHHRADLRGLLLDHLPAGPAPFYGGEVGRQVNKIDSFQCPISSRTGRQFFQWVRGIFRCGL